MIKSENELAANSYLFKMLSFIVVCCTILLLASPYYLYSPIPIFILLALVLFTVKPEMGLYIVIFLIPFGAYRTFGDIKITWAINFWLLIVLFSRLLFSVDYVKRFKSNIWLLLIIFFILNLFSSILSDYKVLAIDNVFKLLIAYLFIILILAFFSDRKSFTSTIPKIIVFSISLSSILGLIGNYFNLPFFQSGDTEFKRNIGGSIDANNLSLMVIFSLPFTFYWLKKSQNKLIRLALIIIILCDISAVFITYSRGGFVIMTLFLAILVYYNYIRHINAKSLGFVVALTVLVGVVSYGLMAANDLYYQRLGNITNTKIDKSVARRYSYLLVGWESFIQSPILGHGTGSFMEIYGKTSYTRHYARKSKPLQRYAHNTYLEILVGSGILGFIVYILIIRKTFQNFWSAAKNFKRGHCDEESEITFVYMFSFSSVILYLLIFSEIYHKYVLLCIALSQIALSLSVQKLKEKK